MNDRDSLRCVKKAFSALAFMNECDESTVASVARAVGIPRPTSYRILETLASAGYVEKRPGGGSYRITRKVQDLAVGFRKSNVLLEVAKPLIAAKGRELGWPLALYTPQGRSMVARINTDHDCAMTLERYHIGHEIPILNTTTGYCYLAHCAESERQPALIRSLEGWRTEEIDEGPERAHFVDNKRQGYWDRFDNRCMEDVLRVIDIVARQKFCNIELKERREGSLAVPLFLEDGPVGSIAMRYMKSVLKGTGRLLGRYEPELQQLSQEITNAYTIRLRTIRKQAPPLFGVTVINQIG